MLFTTTVYSTILYTLLYYTATIIAIVSLSILNSCFSIPSLLSHSFPYNPPTTPFPVSPILQLDPTADADHPERTSASIQQRNTLSSSSEVAQLETLLAGRIKTLETELATLRRDLQEARRQEVRNFIHSCSICLFT